LLLKTSSSFNLFEHPTGQLCREGSWFCSRKLPQVGHWLNICVYTHIYIYQIICLYIIYYI
jgi:hypothetical protein